MRETLESMLDCSPAPQEIIVVDGDQRFPASSIIDELAGQTTGVIDYVVAEPGLTRQRNAGLRASSGDVVVFVDDDVILDRDVFAVLADGYADDSIVGATVRVTGEDARRIGGRHSALRRLLVRGASEGGFTTFGYPRYCFTLDEARDVQFMAGCFMSARRSDALQVLFDESLPGYALGEDEDFSCRLSRRGRIRYLPNAAVFHRRIGYSSQDARSLSKNVVINRAYLFRKNFPQTNVSRAQFAFFILVLFVHRMMNLDWQGIRGLLEGGTHVFVKGGAGDGPWKAPT